MNTFTINANADYSNNQYFATVMHTGAVTGLSSITVEVTHPKGYLVSSFTADRVGELNYKSIFEGSGSFGLELPSCGYDQSIIRTDLSGLWYSEPMTNWELAYEAASFSGDIQTLEAAIADTVKLTKRNNAYNQVPIVITRGDAVVQGAIDVVSGSNFISLTYDKKLSIYTGYNLNDCLVRVLSGANSGEVFSVTSHTAGQSGFYVDKNCYGYSGVFVAVQPYRIVTAYSGWNTDYQGSPDNLGNGGINARFTLDQNIPNKVGGLYYTSGTYSGVATFAHPYDTTYTHYFSGSVVALKKDTYLRDIAYGDIVYYNPQSDPSATATGVVISVSEHAVAAEGEHAVTIWPAQPVYTGSTFSIFRGNKFTMQFAPEFSTQYMVTAISGRVPFATEVFKTPGVSLDFAANEFESTYNNVTETSYFHVGPLTLDNGEMLTGREYLHYDVSVYNGDVTSPTLVTSMSAFSSQSTGVGQNFNGSYYLNGVLTVGASSVFNASETLQCLVTARYGAAKLVKTISIPVQPAI